MSPAPTPYPVGGVGTPLYTADLTAWLSNPAWVRTGDALLVDAWAGPNVVSAVAAHLAYWGNNPATEQSPFLRSTQAAFTIPGLPPSSFVTVIVNTQWRLGSFIDGFVGMKVAGTPFAPGAGPTGTLTAPTVPMVGYGTTDVSGNLAVAFALGNLHPSFNLNISFVDLNVYLGFADPDPFRDIIIDSAVLYHSENIPVSITRGGATFAPNEEWEEMPFPGKTAPVYGGDQIVSMRPKITTTFMLTGERQFLIYRPGGAWADSSYGRTYTPGEMRTALAAGSYLSGVRCIWQRLRGDYIQVRFPKALVRSYGIEGRDLNEGGLAVEIEARQDLTTGTPGTVRPYLIDILPFGATV